jgi:hypothetical protein
MEAKMGRPRKEPEQNKVLSTEEIIEKIAAFLEEKQQLDVPSCYMICKRLMEDYWDEWANGSEQDDSSDEVPDEDFDIPDDEVPEPPQELRTKSSGAVLERTKDGRILAKPFQKQNVPPMPVI